MHSCTHLLENLCVHWKNLIFEMRFWCESTKADQFIAFGLQVFIHTKYKYSILIESFPYSIKNIIKKPPNFKKDFQMSATFVLLILVWGRESRTSASDDAMAHKRTACPAVASSWRGSPAARLCTLGLRDSCLARCKSQHLRACCVAGQQPCP